jgi:hypothetical protein
MPTQRTAPDLSLPLAQPITLTRGSRSHLVTLMDAAILIRDLEAFRARRARSDRAAEIDAAAARGARSGELVGRRASRIARRGDRMRRREFVPFGEMIAAWSNAASRRAQPVRDARLR